MERRWPRKAAGGIISLCRRRPGPSPSHGARRGTSRLAASVSVVEWYEAALTHVGVVTRRRGAVVRCQACWRHSLRQSRHVGRHTSPGGDDEATLAAAAFDVHEAASTAARATTDKCAVAAATKPGRRTAAREHRAYARAVKAPVFLTWATGAKYVAGRR